MSGRLFGYARVSVGRYADANNLENQRRALANCDLGRERTLAGLERVKGTVKHLGWRKGSVGSGVRRYSKCASATASHGAAPPR